MIRQKKTALLLGASGFIGNQLLQLLLDDDSFDKVIALVRKPLEISDPKLEQRITDFANEQLYREAMPAGDVIFCCIGTTMQQVRGNKTKYRQIDYDIPVQAAKWGIEKGYTQYILVSAIGADARSSNFYLRLKGEVETAVASIPYKAVHIFQPSLLLGHRKESRPTEKMAQFFSPLFSMLTIGGFKKYRPVKGNTVANAMLKASDSDITGTHTYTYSAIQSLAL